MSFTVRCLAFAALAWSTPALAGPPSYTFTFTFADATTVLPSGISTDDVLTIATITDGAQTDGVILLASGGAIYFESHETRPLLTSTAVPDAFAALGK